MTYEEISKILESKDYRFAKTMAEHPHSYTLIDEWENRQEFYNVVQYFMRMVSHLYKAITMVNA